MRFARVWTSDDGVSHISEEALGMAEGEVPALQQSAEMGATSVQVRRFAPGFVSTWHPAASSAVFAVWISGSVVFDASDGTSVRMAEDGVRCMVFEDRTGKGHRLRVDKDTGATYAIVRLA